MSKTKHVDSVMMYCSLFTYGKNATKLRKDTCEIDVKQMIAEFQKYESK